MGRESRSSAGPVFRLRRLFWLIALAGLACEVGIAFTTVLPGAPYVPQWPQFALLPFVFLVFGFAVFRGPSDWRISLRSLPRWVSVAFGALVVATVVGFLTAFVYLRGQPEQRGSRYFLNDHGHMIPVSHSGYEDALAYQQRIFTLIPSVFFAVAAIGLSTARKADSPDAPPT